MSSQHSSDEIGTAVSMVLSSFKSKAPGLGHKACSGSHAKWYLPCTLPDGKMGHQRAQKIVKKKKKNPRRNTRIWLKSEPSRPETLAFYNCIFLIPHKNSDHGKADIQVLPLDFNSVGLGWGLESGLGRISTGVFGSRNSTGLELKQKLGLKTSFFLTMKTLSESLHILSLPHSPHR